MATLDTRGHIVHANAALERLLGAGDKSLTGRPIAECCSPDDAHRIRSLLDVHAGPAECGSTELRVERRDGSIVWCLLTVSPLSADARVHLLVVVQDITERKATEARLLHQAYHDPLTSLANRELFRERMEHALTRCTREAERIAVIILDLDNFKSLNDTLGHGAGDQLLKVVSRRLQSATRGCDTVARLGGDEFGILLEHLDVRAGAEAVAERVVAALRQPIPFDNDRTINTGGSLGIAIYSGTEGTEELMRNADVAMYEAKLHAPGRWVVFDPAMHRALIDRVTLENDLRRALVRCQLLQRPRLENTGVYPAFEPRRPAKSEFSIAYQPVVDLATGRPSAMEALARWTHPTLGEISPDAFIPPAESNGSIHALGRWVLLEACRQMAEWNARRGSTPVKIMVNLSARQLEVDELRSDVESVLRETNLPPHLLVLEITETAIMQNAEATLSRLRELKRLGIGLAIDDFGTGYSSLAYLQRFPVDVLKIDRIFTEEVRSIGDGSAVIRTILALADLRNLQTIAEGVEVAAQRDALREMGCQLAQGYLFGRPLASADAERALGLPAVAR